MFYYQHNIGDFDKATRHLSRLERSVYRDLIDLYYDTEYQLNLDIKYLCRKILALSNEESTAVEQVLIEFFTKTPNGWYHDRCEEEIEKFKNSKTQKSEAGKKSAAARQEKRERALNGRSTELQQESNGAPTKQETITIKHKPLNKYIPPIPTELFTEYQAIRKSKRAAPFTERMYTAICNQAVLAGITPEQAITLCCEKGWTGFNADWVKDKSVKPMKGYGFVSDAQFNDWLESAPTLERIANE